MLKLSRGHYLHEVLKHLRYIFTPPELCDRCRQHRGPLHRVTYVTGEEADLCPGCIWDCGTMRIIEEPENIDGLIVRKESYMQFRERAIKELGFDTPNT